MTVEEQFPVDPIIFKRYRESVDLTNFPREFVHGFIQLAEEEKTKWYEGRFRCLKYHRYLAGYAEAEKAGDPNLPKEYTPVLGMDFQANPHDQLFGQFIRKRPGEGLVLSDLEPVTKKRMILLPRLHFKTAAVRVDIIQTILNYPNARLLFLTGGDKLAKVQLNTIKKFFERPTVRFRYWFPEFCLRDVRNHRVTEFLEDGSPNPRAWVTQPAKLGTSFAFTVPCRTSEIFAEATFTISTAKSVKAGSHYDIIYIDDLVNETNYRKVDALQKCYDNYIDVCPLLEPRGFMVVTGTRYSFGDTYERIQEDAKKEMKETGRSNWRFSIRDCWSHGCQNCVHTNVYHDYALNIIEPPCLMCGCPGYKNRGDKGVLFPETRTQDGRSIGFTLEDLEAKKREYGAEFFANQFENQPIASGSQTFDEMLIGRQTLHHLEQIPVYGQGLTFIVGDLAYVGQEGRDYSVLMACRMFQGQIFIYACEYGNWDSSQFAKNLLDMTVAERPDVIYLEKNQSADAMNNVITAEAKVRSILKVPIEWQKCSQVDKAKLIRIGTVKGPLVAGRLWFYAAMKGYQILSNQLIKWPKLGRHDDFADCAGMVVAAPTNYQQQKPPSEVALLAWLRKLGTEIPIDDSYGDNGCGTGIVC